MFAYQNGLEQQQRHTGCCFSGLLKQHNHELYSFAHENNHQKQNDCDYSWNDGQPQEHFYSPFSDSIIDMVANFNLVMNPVCVWQTFWLDKKITN